MPGAVLAELPRSVADHARRLDTRRPARRAFSAAAAQNSIGRCPGQMSASDKRAVVLLSGGLDSATVLAVARSQGFECYALIVHDDQRHRAVLHAAKRVAAALGAYEHRTMGVDLAGIGGSALTDTR